jgi:putative spermidine/putrescine transport system permease protein
MRENLIPLLRRWWLFLFVAAVITFLIVPIAVVIPVSFSDSKYLQFPPVAYSLRWYENFWHSPDWLAAARASLTAAVLTVIVATPVGVAAAYGINSFRPATARLAQLVLLLPMLVPSILIAIGIFYIYIRLRIVNSMAGIVIAHTVLALPFVVLTMLAAFHNFDFRQEQAAISLGASPFSAFIRVTLPQLKASVISAALFAFITSLDEVIVGLFVAGGENTVLTRRMFLALRDQVDPTVAAISTILIFISVAFLCALALLRRHPHR